MIDQLISALIVYILFSVFLVIIVHFILIRRRRRVNESYINNISKIEKYSDDDGVEGEEKNPRGINNNKWIEKHLHYAIPLTRNKILKVSGREFLTFAALLKCAREKLKNPLCTDDEAWLHYVTFATANYFKYLIFVSSNREEEKNIIISNDSNPSIEYLSKTFFPTPYKGPLLNRLGQVVTDKEIFREYVKLLFQINKDVANTWDDEISFFSNKHPNIPKEYIGIDLTEKMNMG
uniref:Wsv021-like protein n=1 Tax=Armadillidium vulgare clopovirus TaxID=2984284 RepID=A0A9C7F0Z6_9VIRU|nr:MAG: wsv021-like protein [Armadillidium vulgare clopovirus]